MTFKLCSDGSSVTLREEGTQWSEPKELASNKHLWISVPAKLIIDSLFVIIYLFYLLLLLRTAIRMTFGKSLRDLENAHGLQEHVPKLFLCWTGPGQWFQTRSTGPCPLSLPPLWPSSVTCSSCHKFPETQFPILKMGQDATYLAVLTLFMLKWC